jgi:hypothetical protein
MTIPGTIRARNIKPFTNTSGTKLCTPHVEQKDGAIALGTRNFEQKDGAIALGTWNFEQKDEAIAL